VRANPGRHAQGLEEYSHMTKKPLVLTVTASLALLSFSAGVTAQEDSNEGSSIFPVEVYTCNYHDGKGSADLDRWVTKWNAWVDSDPEPYSAWTLTPFYYGDEQDFDFIWLGASPDATALGRAYDKYLGNPALNSDFQTFASCDSHSNFAAMNVKQPPDDDAKSFVINFSDCKIAEGKTFADVEPALKAWSEYRTGHGSQAGMWVLWPAFGGGGADFDFKFVDSYRNYASLGADYDQYGKEGYKKADELFVGVLDCDDARSYIAMERRDGIPDD
jgi:hypothetical protein